MVEWKKIGESCKTVSPPKKLEKELYGEEGLYPIIDQGQKDIVGYTFDESALVPDGEYILFGDHTRYVKYHKGVFAQGADGLKILRAVEGILPRFLYFAFANTEVPSRGYSRHWSIAKELHIPIPSLSEQTRIVGILDTFTASIENLKQQIAQRRKQYNWIIDHFYYSDKYEMIKAADEGKVQVKTMDEIGTFIRGRRFVRTDIVQEGVPCIHYGDMYTYYGVWADKTPTFLTKEKASKLRFAKKGDVVIVAAGENDIDIGVGVAWLGEKEVVVHDACFIFKHEMDPKYISYFLRSMNYHLQIRMGVVDGKICSISAKELGRTLVPVPSLAEQQRIVSILDTFEDGIHRLESQLFYREKQYCYYRNKLLTLNF